jgi:ATP-dependent Clp protease ATP-binding subunit ClpC
MSQEPMNNFTPRAQQVLALARKEADRFHHNYVGTEHILLSLVDEQDSTAATLAGLGVTKPAVQQQITASFAALQASRSQSGSDA